MMIDVDVNKKRKMIYFNLNRKYQKLNLLR